LGEGNSVAPAAAAARANGHDCLSDFGNLGLKRHVNATPADRHPLD
jgi:hypothetical protein